MTHNAALRSIATALRMNEDKVLEVVRLGGGDVDAAAVSSWLKGDGEAGGAACPDKAMAQFLNGLVVSRRGTQPGQAPAPLEPVVTNNVILKKVRVALNLQDRDVAAFFVRAGANVTKSERAAFFRRRDDSNYRECGDAVLLKFLASLTG